jgi:hypothetical protein
MGTDRQRGSAAWFMAYTLFILMVGPNLPSPLEDAEWDAGEVRRYVIDYPGQPSGILILDETGFLKKGTRSSVYHKATNHA